MHQTGSGAAKAAISRRLRPAAALPLRSLEIDALRGWSIVLMILAHLDVWLGILPGFNDSVGRVVMPAFMIAAGWCFRPRWSFRYVELVAAAGLTTFLYRSADLAQYPILYVFVLCLPVLLLVHRWPLLLVFLGYLQIHSAPLVEWSGYQPGEVLLWLGVGVLVRSNNVLPFTIPAPWGILAIGGWPLCWYVGHIFLLWILAGV